MSLTTVRGSYGGEGGGEILHREDLGNEKNVEGWERLQYKAFLRWVNFGLGRRGLRIDALEAGLQDGLMLHALLEVLSKKTIRRIHRRASMRVHMINNHFILFEFLKGEEAVRLENIGPEDIVDQDTKLILGLIWALILKYTLSRHLQQHGTAPFPHAPGFPLAPGATYSLTSSSPSTHKPSSPVAQLLANLNHRLAPYQGDKPGDLPVFPTLARAMADGRPLLALIHSKAPHLLPHLAADFQAKKRPIDYLQQAFPLLEHDFQAALLLDPHDLADGQPDDKTLMTFLSGILDAIDSHSPPLSSASVSAPVPTSSSSSSSSPSSVSPAPAPVPRSVGPSSLSASPTPNNDRGLSALDNLMSDLASPSPSPAPKPAGAALSALDDMISGLAAPVGAAPAAAAGSSKPTGVSPTALSALDDMISGLAAPSAPSSSNANKPPATSSPALGALDDMISGLAGPSRAPSSTTGASPTSHAQPSAASKPAGDSPALSALDDMISGLAGPSRAPSAPSASSSLPAASHAQPSAASPTALSALDDMINGLAGPSRAPSSDSLPAASHAQPAAASKPAGDSPALSALDDMISGLAGPSRAPSSSSLPAASHAQTPAGSKPAASPTALNALDDMISGLAGPSRAPSSSSLPAASQHHPPTAAKSTADTPALSALDDMISGLAGPSRAPSSPAASVPAAQSASKPAANPTALNALDDMISGLAGPSRALSSHPSHSSQQPSSHPSHSSSHPSHSSSHPSHSSHHPSSHSSAVPASDRDKFDDLEDLNDGFPKTHPQSENFAHLPRNLRNFNDGLDSVDETAPTVKQALRRLDPSAFLEMLVRTVGRPIQQIIQYLEGEGFLPEAQNLRHHLTNLLHAAKRFADVANNPASTVAHLAQARDQTVAMFPPLVDALVQAQNALNARQAGRPSAQASAHSSVPSGYSPSSSSALPSPRSSSAGAGASALPSPRSSASSALPSPRSSAAPSGDATPAKLLAGLLSKPIGTAGGVSAEEVLNRIKAFLEEMKRNLESLSDPDDFAILQQALKQIVLLVNQLVDELNRGGAQPTTCHNLGQALLKLEELWYILHNKARQQASSAPSSAQGSQGSPSIADALEQVLANPAIVERNKDKIAEQIQQVMRDAQGIRDSLDVPEAQQLVHRALEEFRLAANGFLRQLDGGRVDGTTAQNFVAAIRKLEAALAKGQDMCRKICSVCAKDISGSYVSIDSKNMHSHCFVCHTCRSPLSRYVFVDGHFYCEEHNPSSTLVCCVCHKKITSTYVGLEDNQYFHPDCLRCAQCNITLSGQFCSKNGRHYCTTCA